MTQIKFDKLSIISGQFFGGRVAFCSIHITFEFFGMENSVFKNCSGVDMGKVALTKVQKTSTFRKMAMGTWKTAKDPSVYGLVEIDLHPTLEKIKEYEIRHKVKITPAHLVGCAVAKCMTSRPEINGMIRFGRLYQRDHVALFYQVNIPGSGHDRIKKANLAGAVLHNAENMSLAQIAQELARKSELVKTDKDEEIKKGMNTVKFIPWQLMGPYLDLVSFLLYGLNLDLSFLGIPKDPFGSVMITNVGGMGIDIAWAPLCPYTRVPLLITVGAIAQKPWVVDGEVKVRPILPLGITLDHRFIDGVHASQMAKEFKEFFAHPEKYFFNH